MKIYKLSKTHPFLTQQPNNSFLNQKYHLYKQSNVNRSIETKSFHKQQPRFSNKTFLLLRGQ